jgi:THAP domain-containing protein 4
MDPAVEPIAFLIGTWRGEGRGIYPTIASFDYGEEIEFKVTAKPMLVYTQKTWDLADDSPMHSEMGFWRPQPEGKLEVVLAHPFGATEILEGSVDGTAIDLKSTGLQNTTSAMTILATARSISVEDGELTYTVSMAVGEQELQNHLTARLEKVG